jgi:hypothetical protein
MCATIVFSCGTKLPANVSIRSLLPRGARTARNRQRRLERTRREIDPVRRQLGNAVRHDRAREVDRLAACAARPKVNG